jgi:hypothetical protein
MYSINVLYKLASYTSELATCTKTLLKLSLSTLNRDAIITRQTTSFERE